ncbi:hypothetical protein [Polyangium mundeleinium]|uniref:FecR protein domain-containing protein n=1 Tax=Polyangium mundeleinium TaxID=2995306 RepID=A0ABT5EQJ7_9BACT|nr:hypothetical protein [Polyangium mundeleinium]MDC0744110.1 hypothetical protein [Polyangium mundeleinium]
MKDDDLLDALGRAARKNDLLADPRWDALARGELSDEEIQKLAEGSAATRDAVEAFRPLGAQANACLTEQALVAIGAQNPGAAPAEVVRIHRPRRALLALFAACLTAAVAFVLLSRNDAEPPLPMYALSVEGGDRSFRADAPSPDEPRLAPGSRLSLSIRPAADVLGVVEARAYSIRDGVVAPCRPRIEIAATGAILVTGSREELFPDIGPGRLEIAILVGRPETLPEHTPAASELAPEGPTRAFQVLRAAVWLTDPNEK